MPSVKSDLELPTNIFSTDRTAVHTYASGNRASPLHVLTPDEIELIVSEIDIIKADRDAFVFNSLKVRGTCFLPSDGKIHIKGNIFPDQYSTHPRDKLSVRAVLAHEYYGHRPFRQQYLAEDHAQLYGDEFVPAIEYWADEFRASYMAAKIAPGLTDEDKSLLIQDAVSRAMEAGVSIKNNRFMKGVLYGFFE